MSDQVFILVFVLFFHLSLKESESEKKNLAKKSVAFLMIAKTQNQAENGR